MLKKGRFFFTTAFAKASGVKKVSKGRLVVFEGIDASGKNFQLHNLEKRLEDLNKWQDVVRTHEPWKSAEIKRKLLKTRIL